MNFIIKNLNLRNPSYIHHLFRKFLYGNNTYRYLIITINNTLIDRKCNILSSQQRFYVKPNTTINTKEEDKIQQQLSNLHNSTNDKSIQITCKDISKLMFDSFNSRYKLSNKDINQIAICLSQFDSMDVKNFYEKFKTKTIQ